jgi:predicted DNA binding CopG/RHH family protein
MENKMSKLVTEMSKAEFDDQVAKQVLDDEEQEIESALVAHKKADTDELAISVMAWQAALENTERKSPVTLRLSGDVMRRLKLKARKEGLPYQTLVSSILHRYVHGHIKDVN